MIKNLAVAVSVIAASLGLAGIGEAARPSEGSARFVGIGLSGSPATFDPIVGVVPGSVSGSIALTVDQPSSQPIVMANIDLGSGFTIDAVSSVQVRAGNGATCTGTPEILYLNEETITAKDFSCVDSDNDGSIEFQLRAVGISATTTIEEVGDHKLVSQYRTNADRRIKSITWVIQDDTAINLSEDD